MHETEPLPARFTIQTVGGPIVARVTFSLDRQVSLASHLTQGPPVPEDLDATLRAAYADTLLLDHGLFAAAWTSADDEAALLADHDRLVQAVLAIYAPARIVLLRSSVRRFHWAGSDVRASRYGDDGRDVEALRGFLDGLDRRFAQATGCTVVDALATHLPTADGLAHDPRPDAEAILAIEEATLAAFRDPEGHRDAVRPPMDTPFAHAVAHELGAGPLTPQRVADLLPEQGIETFEDAAALAAAFSSAREADWSQVAARAMPSQGAVWDAARARFAANLSALRRHPHVYVPGGLDLEPRPGLVIALGRSWFVVLQPGRARPLQMRRYGRQGRFDLEAFCEGGYVCRAPQIEWALESWEAYFERGRRGDSAPFRLAFADAEAFRESLDFLDYAEILANESYCLTIDGAVPSELDWQARVDVSFLFDPRTVVCRLAGGFGDQLFRYAEVYRLTGQHGLRLVLDDLEFDAPWRRLSQAHARPDLIELAEGEGLFSRLISKRLRQRRRGLGLERREYASLGLHEQIWIVDRIRAERPLAQRTTTSALLVVPLTADNFERSVVSPPPGVRFVDVLPKPERLDAIPPRDRSVWEHCLRWPGFTSAGAEAVAERMLASDAVVAHVRRGDRASLGMADGDDYYRRFLTRIAELTEFSNKELFVFSDDLDYCREHRDPLGLDLLGGAVTFVEGNRHFASIDDFHLMTLGRVIVCGRSGFSATAALTSARVEYIFGEGYGADGGDVWHRPAGGSAAP